MDCLVDPGALGVLGDLLEPLLCLGFMQRALIAGILVVVTTSVIGTWVVVRGLTFMGDALAHGVLPGIALALIIGFSSLLGAALGALVMVVGINFIHSRAKVTEDTAIGLLFVGMLALGVIIISRSDAFAVTLTSVLFGDPIGTTTGDLVVEAIAAVVTLVTSALLYRPFLVLSFNRQKAEVLGMRPRIADLAMMALITLAILSSFQAVGTLLVFGLLIAPPATASLVARRVPWMMGTAAAIGTVAVTAGLLVSYHLDTAAGATMSGMAVFLFFVVLALRGLGRRREVRPA
jgi:ABC-type Mn2+/Zn2+ transport system permease subunit